MSTVKVYMCLSVCTVSDVFSDLFVGLVKYHRCCDLC